MLVVYAGFVSSRPFNVITETGRYEHFSAYSIIMKRLKIEDEIIERNNINV